MINSKVIPIWQPLGSSTYKITESVAKFYGEKATHTGVLDPLAEGVIVVLVGEERFKKLEYADCVKGYEFDVTFGISTDSYDGMGLITNHDFSRPVNLTTLETILKSIVSADYEQTVPLYSGKKIGGKKLFMYPKLNLPLPELPLKKGKIYKLSVLNTKTVLLTELINTIIKNVKAINIGEFRQKDILHGWESFLSESQKNTELTTASLYAETSKGIYVRSLSQDICAALGLPGFVTRLVRTKNGDFTKESCKSINTFIV